MKSLNPIFLIFLTLILLTAACTDEEIGIEDQLIGIWTLSEKTVDDVPVSLSDCEKLSTIEFQEYNFCILYDACAGDSINSGWSYRYEMLNIAELLPVAFYINEITDNALVIKRNDITSQGELQSTIQSYLKKH